VQCKENSKRAKQVLHWIPDQEKLRLNSVIWSEKFAFARNSNYIMASFPVETTRIQSSLAMAALNALHAVECLALVILDMMGIPKIKSGSHDPTKTPYGLPLHILS